MIFVRSPYTGRKHFPGGLNMKRGRAVGAHPLAISAFSEIFRHFPNIQILGKQLPLDQTLAYIRYPKNRMQTICHFLFCAPQYYLCNSNLQF